MITTIMFGLLMIGWVGEWPPAIDAVMYDGHWRSWLGVFSPLFTPVPGISLFPWQLMLFALAPFCLVTAGPSRHARAMDRAILLSIGCVAVTFLWGLVHGGSPYFAYYQLWRFLAALLIAYMIMSAARSERDLVTLGKLIVLAALIRATLCIYFFWWHLNGKVDPNRGYVTNHDDTMLFVVATLIVTMWAFFKGGKRAWVVAAVVVAYVFYAVVLNDRRIAWVELGLSLPLIYVLLGPGPLRSRVNRWLMWAAPAALLYIVAGLGSTSGIFAPVHALVTTGSNYDPSSLTRQEEARNLLHTLVDIGNPLFGTGWGRPYDKAETYWSNYDADWILTLYTPHNAILGLAAYSGLLGIIGIWGVVPMGAYLAARGYAGTTSLVSRTAAMVAAGAILAYSVHTYGDIGLQSFVGCLVFGTALGVAGKVAAFSDVVPEPNAWARRFSRRRAPPAPRPTSARPDATGQRSRRPSMQRRSR